MPAHGFSIPRGMQHLYQQPSRNLNVYKTPHRNAPHRTALLVSDAVQISNCQPIGAVITPAIALIRHNASVQAYRADSLVQAS